MLIDPETEIVETVMLLAEMTVAIERPAVLLTVILDENVLMVDCVGLSVNVMVEPLTDPVKSGDVALMVAVGLVLETPNRTSNADDPPPPPPLPDPGLYIPEANVKVGRKQRVDKKNFLMW